MAGINIDELIISFGFDPKGLTDGEKVAMATIGRTKKALTDNANDAEAQAKRARAAIADTAKERAKVGEQDSDRIKHAKDTQKEYDKLLDQEFAKRIAQGKVVSAAETAAARRRRELERESRNEKKRHRREEDSEIRNTAELFKAAKNQALGYVAAAVSSAAVIGFSRNAITSDASLGRTALNAGISVPQLSTFQNLAARNGGSAEAAAGAVAGIAQQMELLKVTGKNAILPYLRMLPGVNARSNVSDIYNSASLFADQHRGDRQLVNLVLGGLGLDQATINSMLKGRKGYQEDLAAARRESITPEEAAKAQKLQDSLKGLEQAVTKAGKTVLYRFEPQIDAVAKFLNDVADKWPGATAAVTAFTVAIGPLLLVIGKITALARALGLISAPAAGGAAAAGEAAVAEGAGIGAGALATGAALTAATLALKGDAPPAHPGYDERPNLLNRIWPGIKRRFNSVFSNGSVSDDVDYFVKQGWTKEQAAGIVSNIQAESGGDPTAFNPAGGGQGAFGLGQWRGPRIDALKAFAASRGLDYRSKEAQLAFYDYELRNGQGGDQLSQAKTGADASTAVLKYFERPAANEFAAAASTRARGADAILSRLGPGPAPDAGLAAASSRLNGSLGTGASTSTSSTDVTIGAVNVNVPNGDPKTIAAGVGGALKSSITTQANQGQF